MDLATIATQLKDLGTALSALSKLLGTGETSVYGVVNSIAQLFGASGSSAGEGDSSAIFAGSSDLFAGSSDLFDGSADGSSSSTTQPE